MKEPIRKLREHIKEWPNPWKHHAQILIRDAELDWCRWPDLWRKILADVKSSVSATEKLMNDAARAQEEQP